ncbi:MAG TPA: cupredoxin domain-containing protein [Thermoanaerobaculia bacterium]|nr:cupredoxin domain-containing protein [Thermoanaerobaculia bacterium]
MRKAVTFVSVAAVALLGVVLRAQDTAPATSEPQKITVTAKKYDFNPSHIEVKVGQPVEITFQSEDTKHGFEQKDLGIQKVVFSKDEPQTVKFTPAKAGTYPFKCAKFCGMGHSGMKGEIVVKD